MHTDTFQQGPKPITGQELSRLPVGTDTHRSIPINGVELGRKVGRHQDFVGLLLSHDNEAELEWLRSLELEDKTIEVIEAPAGGNPET